MTSLIEHLLASYGYYLLFFVIGLESIGVPLPGETVLIAAAVYAGSTNHLNVGVIAVVAAAAAILGDNIGFAIGATGGQRVVTRFGHLVRLDAAKMRMGRYLFDRHGSKVVFFGRFISILRTFAAFLAGTNKMPWPRFQAANAAGGIMWAAIYAFGAYLLGSAAASIGTTVALVGLGAAVVAGLVATTAMRKPLQRVQERADAAYPELAPAASS